MTSTVVSLADWRAMHPPAPRPAPVDYRLVWVELWVELGLLCWGIVR